MNLPPFVIDTSLITALRQYSAAAEKKGSLVPEQLQVIYQEKWFKMFVPQHYHGMQLSLPDGLLLEESLARTDGSLGWAVTLCSGATMFAGYLQPEAAVPLFEEEKVCFGGSGRPGGIATITENGYEISGNWPYATGAPHTTVFTANCFIEENGERLLQADGSPLIQSFFFFKDEVMVEEDWNTMGLIATAGHSFKVNNLKVAGSRTFKIAAESATLPDALYQYPFLPIAETTLAVNTLGMALHFFEECERLFQSRQAKVNAVTNGTLLLGQLLQEAVTKLLEGRKAFYDAVHLSWKEQTQNGKASAAALAAVGQQSRDMVWIAREQVQKLFPYLGLEGANPATDINRIWRDIYTASQHTLLTYPPVS